MVERAGPFALNQFRLTVASLVFILVLLVTGLVHSLPVMGSPSVGWLALSGVVGPVVGDAGFFGALSRLGPRVTTLLSALTPPITAVLARRGMGDDMDPLVAVAIRMVAATLMSTVPILILPLIVLVRKEPVGGRAVLGAVLAVAGVALMFARRG